VTAQRVRVVKLGGSLLGVDGLADRFRRWHTAQTPEPCVMIAGGGPLADVVRDAFRRHRLSEAAAHWLCVGLLNVTAELLHCLLPESELLADFSQLSGRDRHPPLTIFQVEAFLRRQPPRQAAEPLPHTWEVTSDSIAARLATALEAGELVLLKSGLPSHGASLQQAADAGYVDAFFPRAARQLATVRCVDLRADGFPQRRLGGE